MLPLTDQSETPSPSLAAGLTDQLINTVGQIGSLRVTSPASVMTLRGASRSSREIGTTLGVAGSLVAARYLETVLFGITRTDVPTYAGVAALLLVVGVVAAWVPARRAVAMSPLAAIRPD